MGERKAATAEEEQERRKREAATAEEEAVPATRSASATRGDGRRRIRTGDSHRTSPLPSDPHSCAPNPPCPVGRALHRRQEGGEGRGGVGEKRRTRPFPLVRSGRGSGSGGGGNCGGGSARGPVGAWATVQHHGGRGHQLCVDGSAATAVDGGAGARGRPP
uniref:Uncharacterized protein n=1 Tax=Oryza rufipogon TaxID=4529 RepID=A0A0E0QGP1_ORYRU